MKKLLLGLSTLSLVILPIATMASCSSDTSFEKIEDDITTQEYQTFEWKSGAHFGFAPTKIYHPNEANYMSPLLSSDAKNILNEKSASLTVELLQKDFDSVITPLYIINQDKVQTPVKIIENGIKVMSVQAPIWGIGGYALLSVSYLEGDSLEVKTKDNISWMIKGTISEPIELAELKNSLTSTNIELPIFKDYFLAENTGILNKVSTFQRKEQIGELGGLLGYHGSLNQILPALMTTPRPVVGGSSEFFIPSKSLDNTFLYPSITGQLDYTFNKEVVSKMTDKEILLMSTPDDLLSILAPSKKTSKKISTVKRIEIEHFSNYQATPGHYKIRIIFHEMLMIPELLTMGVDLAKPNA